MPETECHLWGRVPSLLPWCQGTRWLNSKFRKRSNILSRFHFPWLCLCFGFDAKSLGLGSRDLPFSRNGCRYVQSQAYFSERERNLINSALERPWFREIKKYLHASKELQTNRVSFCKSDLVFNLPEEPVSTGTLQWITQSVIVQYSARGSDSSHAKFKHTIVHGGITGVVTSFHAQFTRRLKGRLHSSWKERERKNGTKFPPS